MNCRGDLHKWHRWGLIVAVLICTKIHLCWSQSPMTITLDPPNPTVGQNVSLNTDYNGTIFMINWIKGNGTIVTYNPGANFTPTHGDMFTGRETVLKNGSLQISHLQISDSGHYTLQLSIPDSFRRASIELTVENETTPPPVNESEVTPTEVPFLPPTPPKGSSRAAIISIVIGSAAVALLIVAALVIWFKRFRKPRVYASPDIFSKKDQATRLPSIPFPPPIYENNTDAQEHPYEDLAYVYTGSSYHDLHRPSSTNINNSQTNAQIT